MSFLSLWYIIHCIDSFSAGGGLYVKTIRPCWSRSLTKALSEAQVNLIMVALYGEDNDNFHRIGLRLPKMLLGIQVTIRFSILLPWCHLSCLFQIPSLPIPARLRSLAARGYGVEARPFCSSIFNPLSDTSPLSPLHHLNPRADLRLEMERADIASNQSEI
jgi:hypothetical protein